MHEKTDEIADLLIHTMLGVSKQFRCLFRYEQEAQLAPGHFRILAYLIHHQPNLRELAERTMVTSATMSKTVDSLQDHGWITRTQNPDDRRQVIIRLTEKGHALLRSIHQEAVMQVSQKLSTLDEDEVMTLDEGLRILRKVFLNPASNDEDNRSMT